MNRMICSMTGFGQASRSFAGYKVFIDVKSVNHRYCEVAVRMPKEWASFEDSLKKTVLQTVKRGRVDVFVAVEKEAAFPKQVTVDYALADAYMQAAEQLKQRYGFTDGIVLKDLLRLPDLVQMREERSEPDELFEQELCACMRDAVEALSLMREREGRHLAEDIAARLAELKRTHAELQTYAPQVVQEYAAKLDGRVQAILQDQAQVDEQRLAVEIAIFADRSNIDEELIRLQSHFAQFDGLLAAEEPVGRKLDFLIQEMNREVNTIGSKANHAELTTRVIEMKAELEKMREQIQNIE